MSSYRKTVWMPALRCFGGPGQEVSVRSFDTVFVGLDVHKASISACVRTVNGERVEFDLPNQSDAIDRLVKRLRGVTDGEVHAFYEAGPCGFVLQRRLNREDGFRCVVIAPSLIPRKPGERVKTDRRDSRKLMELGRAGLLTEVRPPSPSDEALRDLTRARADTRREVTRARQRINAFLLRKNCRFTGTRSRWTQAHRVWLRRLALEDVWAQRTFDALLQALEQAEGRLEDLDQALFEASQTESAIEEDVALLRCLHGIDTVAAMTVVTELYRFERFTAPQHLMGFLGQTPSEHSSGGSRRQGGITKTGNVHVRRILVECAWAYRRRPHVGAALRKRRTGQPAWAIAIADKARRRLYKRYWHLVSNGKHPNKAISAVARELTGFIWAMLTEARLRREAQAA